jgi:Fe-S oxidoreductase
MTIESIIFLIIASSCFGLASYRLLKLIQLMKATHGGSLPLDRVPERIFTTLLNVLGQKAVLEKKAAGIMHATIFWGFIIISFGTLEQFISTLIPGFTFGFLGTTVYSSFLFLHDLFTTLVILAVAYAFYRRLVIRPEGLGQSKDAILVLLFTGGLMLSIFLMHGFHILGTQPWYASALPFSLIFSNFLSILPFSTETYETFSHGFKWIHMLLVMGFSVYIPGSKHLHILAAGPNTFLKKLDIEKSLRPIDFENESITQYGAAKISDLSWKDVLDLYSCTECGRCQDVCPAWNTQKPLSPKLLIMNLKENLYENKSALLDKKYDDVSSIVDQQNTDDVYWACTTCRACEVACPVFIEHTDKIYDVRRNLVMMESRFPAEMQTVFKNMENNMSPWAFSPEERMNWAQGESIPTVETETDFEYLLWVGCAGAFDDRNKKVVRAFVSILKKAGVRFAVLGKQEVCTGDPARRMGNEYLFQVLAKQNIETLNSHSIKKVITTCPHCFNSIKNEYKDFGGTYEVYHHTQLISELIKNGKLKPNKAFDETVTFHDSCYLGRWNGIFEEPRTILQSLPSTKVIEMQKNRENGMCCGAGGGRMWMEETIGKRINITRTEQAISTNASVIAASCPFCMTMLSDGVKAKDLTDKISVMDIAELVDKST